MVDRQKTKFEVAPDTNLGKVVLILKIDIMKLPSTLMPTSQSHYISNWIHQLTKTDLMNNKTLVRE